MNTDPCLRHVTENACTAEPVGSCRPFLAPLLIRIRSGKRQAGEFTSIGTECAHNSWNLREVYPMVSYVHARLKGKTMRDIFRDIKRLLREESGATATEYAVMVALVIIVVIASIAAVGTKVSGMYVDSEQGW